MGKARTSRLITTLAAIVLPAFAGFGAVYVMARSADNAIHRQPPAPSAVTATTKVAQAAAHPAAPIAPTPAAAVLSPSLSQGEMIKFVFKKTPEPLADIVFFDGTGAKRSLKDFAGRTVLLNLWATWCVPCRKEMPALDLLQKELGSDAFEVVALSIDRGGIDASKAFLDSIKIAHLKLYADPTTKMSAALKVIGMPTTILIDSKGREIGRLVGDAAWDSPDAKRLIRETIKQ